MFMGLFHIAGTEPDTPNLVSCLRSNNSLITTGSSHTVIHFREAGSINRITVLDMSAPVTDRFQKMLRVCSIDYCSPSEVLVDAWNKGIAETLEISNCAEFSNVYFWLNTCHNFASQAVLVANLLPVQFKVLVLTFKTMHGMEPGYLRDHLSSIS